MPPKENIKTAYDLFLDKGLVGAVALLAIAALIWAVTRLLKAQDDRIKDQGLFAAALQKTNEGVAALTIEINKSATTALAESSRSSLTLSSSVQGLEKSVQSLDTKVGMLRDEQVRVVAALYPNTPRGRGR